MPALDYINKTAETVHDISAATLKSTAAINMGRAGLVKGLYCTVFITAVSAANLSDGDVHAYFEYTTDNGTTWHRAGVGKFVAGSTGIALQAITFPVELDIVPEQNAPGDLDWRVTVDIGATEADADDFSFQGWLAGQTGKSGIVN